MTIVFLTGSLTFARAEEPSENIEGQELGPDAVFDDRALLDGYTQKYSQENKDILLAMIADDSLGAYKTAAAIKVFKENFAPDILATEKPPIIKLLLHRLNRSDSAFVHIEIMHTLVVLDRYAYFETMVPALIQKMDHYNPVIWQTAYDNVQSIIKGSTRAREARIIFNTLRKTLFLSRKRLSNIDDPNEQLKQKLSLLRWSIKVLGTQELKRLPSEVIQLL